MRRVLSWLAIACMLVGGVADAGIVGHGSRYRAVAAGGGGGTSGGTAALAWSAPSGLVYRGTLTLTTDGTNPFGTGPQVHFYEDFYNATAGADLTTSNSSFTSFDVNAPSAETDDTASGKSMRIWKGAATSASRRAEIDLGVDNLRELFESHKIKIPSGTKFPGATVNNEFATSSNIESPHIETSVWKPIWNWPRNPDLGFFDNDVIVDNYGGQWKITDSNDLTDTYSDFSSGVVDPAVSGHFGWGGRNRFSTWIKADSTDPLNNPSIVWKQIMHATGTPYRGELTLNPLPASSSNSTSEPVFTGASDPTRLFWRYIHIPGFLGNFGDQTLPSSTWDPRESEIYINAGTNAAARVEICNNATWSLATVCEYLHHTSWTNTQINLVLTSGDISWSGTVYLFVTLGDNSTRYGVQLH